MIKTLPSETPSHTLKAVKFDVGYQNLSAFISADCVLSKFAGLVADGHIKVIYKERSLIALLIVLPSPLLCREHIALSRDAWGSLGLSEGEDVILQAVPPCSSFHFVKSKLSGQPFKKNEVKAIIQDISDNLYSDIQVSAFLSGCICLTQKETIFVTRSMAESGKKAHWKKNLVINKHCVGGIPGNRTSIILVPLLAAAGLTIPKTSSRAITSPAGTADTMEVLAPVDLTFEHMQQVVEKEGGCIIWGEKAHLSPADTIFSRVGSMINMETSCTMVASILSKHIAMGTSHCLIDIPVGPTAKVRSSKEAQSLSHLFSEQAKNLGLTLQIIETDGTHPIGRGIGPVLEARDVLSVLRCDKEAPQDLRHKALFLASLILESWGGVPKGKGFSYAETLLTSGQALKKFEAICEAQGGMKEPVLASHTHVVCAPHKGIVTELNNTVIAGLAALAGAPLSPGAGLELHVSLNSLVEKGQPLLTLYAESKEELEYAIFYSKPYQKGIRITEL